VLYPQLAESTLVGVLHYPKGGSDYRGQTISAGFYTLRYGLMPSDANHLGAAPNRDFLLLVPAASDADPNAVFKFPDLVALSEKATGTRHPGSLSLVQSDGGTTVAVSKDDQDHWTFSAPMELSTGEKPSFAVVVKGIGLLINKIYSIQLRQKEAELNSLQNQINPHFLYNTLESIRGAALYHGIHDIAAMSRALSLLFRYSISEHVLVTIHEELQHLENYISIQNFRFENKFELQCSMPPELGNYRILKLTLQPLIENSIKHGLEMKLGKGTIKIDILSLNNSLKIRISDDGVGMQPKKIEELNRSLINDKSWSEAEEDRSHTGIGVRNVNSRIKLYFGGQYV
jgi:two-component sensor histidine kinase